MFSIKQAGNTLNHIVYDHIVYDKGLPVLHNVRLYQLYELQAEKTLDIRLKDPYPSRTLFYNKQGGVVPKPRYFSKGREIILVLYVLEE
jgi:hypothetical protein